MNALCIFNTGSDLSAKTLDVIYSPESIFSLKINTQYTVYGMAIWAGVVHYLVLDTWIRPSWFPGELFAVIDDALPADFHFKLYRKYDISAVWGYKELLNDAHYDGLIERQDKDLEVFFAYKNSLDQQNTHQVTH